MSESQILLVIGGYFLLLIFVAWLTGRKTDNKTFFLGGKKSPWFLVAFGMIGASMSGVTFISVPGWVGDTQFNYMQMVLGYMLGYLVIALILMPVYYRMNVTSIYKYLDDRFGVASYKTGAFYFLLSKIVGAGFRLFLVASVLQLFIFEAWNVPFWLTVAITLGLIIVYTFRGGIRTIVWTDALQTTFMLAALVMTVVLIGQELEWGVGDIVSAVAVSDYSTIFNWDWTSPNFFLKQFLAGAFIAMTMTGLDQDMMQKNLSIRALPEAQRNIYWQMGMYIVFNLIFLALGVLLYIFAMAKFNMIAPEPMLDPVVSMYPNEQLKFLAEEGGLSNFTGGEEKFRADYLFPMLALKYLPPIVGIVFIVGLTAAAYSSADSALTALTTSFCVDFLNFDKQRVKAAMSTEGEGAADKRMVQTRYIVHISFAVVLLITIVLFNLDKSGSVVDKVFTAAGYTYGPLLGLYAFGIFTRRKARDFFVPFICIVSPVVVFLMKTFESQLFGSYVIGHELLLYNGLLTFTLLWVSSLNNGEISPELEEETGGAA